MTRRVSHVNGVDTHNDSITSTLCEKLTEMLALLQAQRWHYQLVHWQVSGESQYGDHLLFQRLYEGLDDEIDSLAEKIMGLVQRDSLGLYAFNGPSQAEKMNNWLLSWEIHTCPIQRSLQSERDFQNVRDKSYKELKTSGGLTLGLDDWIMSTASKHEVNSYLLQQRLGQANVQSSGEKSVRTASIGLLRAWFARSAGRRVHAEDMEED